MDANVQLYGGVILAVILGLVSWNASRVSGNKVAGISKGLFVFLTFALAIGSLWISGVGSYVSPTLSSPLALAVGGTPQVQNTNTNNLNPTVLGCDLGTKTTVTLA